MGSVFNEKWNVKEQHWEEEQKREFGFGHTELQILLVVGDRKIKLRKEFRATVRDLEINQAYTLQLLSGSDDTRGTI